LGTHLAGALLHAFDTQPAVILLQIEANAVITHLQEELLNGVPQGQFYLGGVGMLDDVV
jgi:hypothetical protein